MPTPLSARRASYFFLWGGPFLAAALAAPRALRIPVLHALIGILAFSIGLPGLIKYSFTSFWLARWSM